jgi:MYXO-CTERM domain-containing protein
MNIGNQLSLHRRGFSAVAAVPAFKQLPIYVSEADPDGCAACLVSSTPADAYRLSPTYGTYVIEMSKRTLELASSMGVNIGGLITWAFTFPGTPYFAGYRALGTNGIELPVLGAFRLLGGLNGARLPVTSSGAATLASILANSVRGAADVDSMATLDGDKVHVLVWNYHDDIVTATPATVNLSVKVPTSFGSAVTVTHLRVDEQHGDAYTAWTSQGSPKTPSAVQIEAMQAGMVPAALGAPQSVSVAGGTATISFTLPRSGMSLLTLSSSAPAVDGGASGGAGRAGASGSAGAGGVGGSSPIGSGTGGVTVSGAGGSGGPSAGGSGGLSASGSGGTGGRTGSTGSGGASGDASTGPGESGSAGCSCAVGAGADGGGMLLGLALGVLGSIAALRRRRRHPTAPAGQ